LPAGDATLFDGKTALGRPVLARVEPPILCLTSTDGENLEVWSLAALVRCDRDAPVGAAVLRQDGPARLAISDAALLSELRLAGVDLGQDPGWGPRRWAAFVAAFAGSLALGAILIDQLPALAAPFVPPALERGWSTTIEQVLAADSHRCTSPAGTAALDGLMARLSAAAGLQRQPALTVLDTGLVNAFTLPDGRILLLRGLIDAAASPDEVSGVLAHEIGHVRRHDPTRETLRAMALNMLARSLGWGSSVASQMAALSYGRRAEAAADASAVLTLRQAGLRADGLRSFFVRLQARLGDGDLQFLSDHPATSRRIEVLPSDEIGAPALTPRAWQAVRTDCAR
jgi:Zn-dependent protease with chaperone function